MRAVFRQRSPYRTRTPRTPRRAPVRAIPRPVEEPYVLTWERWDAIIRPQDEGRLASCAPGGNEAPAIRVIEPNGEAPVCAQGAEDVDSRHPRCLACVDFAFST